MVRRFRCNWYFWLFVVLWLGTSVWILPAVVHRLADRGGFWDGGFVQGDGFLLVIARLAQAFTETAILGAIYGFLEYLALFAVVEFLGKVALLLTGRKTLRELASLPPKRSLAEWITLSCFVVASAAVFRVVARWILLSRHALIESLGLALLSVVGSAWMLLFLWLLYKPSE